MTSIYVGNLAHEATEDELNQVFGEFGAVASMSVIKDRETGRPRGFAFVEMPDSNEATEAIKQLDLREIGGRPITVNEARPKSDRPRRGGGGRRRRPLPSAKIDCDFSLAVNTRRVNSIQLVRQMNCRTVFFYVKASARVCSPGV